MNKYVWIKVACVTVSAFSQILLKKSADKTYKNRLFEYLNPYVIVAYGFFFLAMVFGSLSLRGTSLSLNAMLESLSYILIPVLSYLFLKERISRLQMIGIVVIVIGMIVYHV